MWLAWKVLQIQLQMGNNLALSQLKLLFICTSLVMRYSVNFQCIEQKIQFPFQCCIMHVIAAIYKNLFHFWWTNPDYISFENSISLRMLRYSVQICSLGCRMKRVEFLLNLTLINQSQNSYPQGMTFLNQYLELRGECQETYYNLGRAMHQMSACCLDFSLNFSMIPHEYLCDQINLTVFSDLLHNAEFYYKKALTFPPAVRDDPEVCYVCLFEVAVPFTEINSTVFPSQEIFDLSKEIAYNLMLIYLNSGSRDLASLIMQQYLVIWIQVCHTNH